MLVAEAGVDRVRWQSEAARLCKAWVGRCGIVISRADRQAHETSIVLKIYSKESILRTLFFDHIGKVFASLILVIFSGLNAHAATERPPRLVTPVPTCPAGTTLLPSDGSPPFEVYVLGKRSEPITVLAKSPYCVTPPIYACPAGSPMDSTGRACLTCASGLTYNPSSGKCS